MRARKRPEADGRERAHVARKEGIVTRERILAVLDAADGALGAYAILERLSADGARLAPTSVYRALARLVDEGRVHRVESANAFVACAHGERTHAHAEPPVLSICDDCGSVEEHVAPALLETVEAQIGATGFRPKTATIEIHGRCARCHGADAPG